MARMNDAARPRSDGDVHHDPYRVVVVCLGNICRSPTAAAVLRDRLDKAGLSDQVEVDSAGTGDWHVGQPADPRAAEALRRHGYDDAHRARQFQRHEFAEFDLVLAADASNATDLRDLAPTPAGVDKVRLPGRSTPARHPAPRCPTPTTAPTGSTRCWRSSRLPATTSSTGWPLCLARRKVNSSGGRIKLPTWVVRIRLVLRFMVSLDGSTTGVLRIRFPPSLAAARLHHTTRRDATAIFTPASRRAVR